MGIIVMILPCHITPGNKEKVCARHPLICVTVQLNMYGAKACKNRKYCTRCPLPIMLC